MGIKCIPFGRKMDKMAVKITTFSIAKPSKIGIFGLKIYHLATLPLRRIVAQSD
jgi:hypothetical protein